MLTNLDLQKCGHNKGFALGLGPPSASNSWNPFTWEDKGVFI